MELEHHGVKGMKWGVHRFGKDNIVGRSISRHQKKESAYREKLTNIQNNRNVKGTADERRVKFRNRSLASRSARTAGTLLAIMTVGDAVTGQYKNYSEMSRAELAKVIAKKAKKLGIYTAANVAVGDALARSTANRYQQNGRLQKGRKHHVIEREDWAESGIQIAQRTAVPVMILMTLKAAKLKKSRLETEGKQWANRNLARLGSKAFDWDLVSDLGNGFDVIKRA